MAFFLLNVLNAVLFIRPSELIPALASVPLYQLAVIACLVVSFPCVLEQLSSQALVEQPITACVLGLMVAGVLSSLVRFQIAAAWEAFDMFYKVVLYYLLIVGLVTTRDRMRWFLKSMVFCAVVIAGMAVLNHRGDIHMPTFSHVVEGRYISGQVVQIHRMGSTGLFGDPNDLCLMLAQNVILCAYLIADHRSSLLARAFWIAPLALLGHAMVLTDSRGGLAALLGGLGVYLIARFGKKSIPLGVVCFPVLLALFAGRQTNFDLAAGTGQSRIHLWSDHLMLFRSSPIFGIGCNRAIDVADLVAHNSYISMYEELGFGGGTLFLGAFCLALWELVRLGSRRVAILDPEIARMRPYLAASLVCYSLGMMSLTRGYLAPTYNILGIAVAYLRVVRTDPPVPPIRLDGRLIGRFFLLGVGFLIGITLFIRFQVRYG